MISPTVALCAAVSRWLAKCSRTPDGCLLWTGAQMHRGYGKLRVDGILYAAHRAVFMVSRKRAIGDGLHIGHCCNNPTCVEPTHLGEVTRSENMQFMVKCDRWANQYRRAS